MRFNLLRKLGNAVGYRSTPFSADPGPDFNRWGGILGAVSGLGIRTTPLKSPYSQHPYASGAIRLAGTMLGSVPFVIVQEDKAATQRMAGAIESGDTDQLKAALDFETLARAHRPMACRMHQGQPTKPAPAGNAWTRLFSEGAANVAATEWVSATVQQMLGSDDGRAYLVFRGGVNNVMDEKTMPRELAVWPSRNVKPLKDGRFELATSNGKVRLPAHQVCELRCYSPDKAGADSPLRAAWGIMQSDLAAQDWNAEFFKSGGEVGNVLTTDQKITKDQAEAMGKQWDENHKDRRKTAVLGQGTTLQATIATHHEMDFVEQFRLNRESILACLLVHKAAMGVTDDLNRATIDAARKMMWSNLLIPMGSYIEDRLNAHLFSRFNNGREWGCFDISGVPELADDVQMKADALRTLVDSGIPMNDAVRVTGLDLPLYGWGDDPLGHLAALDGEEPAPSKGGGEPAQNGANEVIESQAVKLNGAQIQSAQSVISDLIAGLIPESVAKSLLVAVGISEDVAAKMVKDAKAFKPKKQPDDRQRTIQERYSRAQSKADAWWHSIGTPIERKFQASVRKVFLAIRSEVLTNLDAKRSATREVDLGEIEALLFSTTRYTKALKESTDDLYQRTIESALEGILDELKDSGYSEAAMKFNMSDAAINRWIETKDLRLQGVIKTVRDELRKAITKQVKANATVQQIAKEIRRVSNYQLAPSRTLTIARTETGGASNNIRWLGMEAAGVDNVSWVAASDAREEHRAINDLTLQAAVDGKPYDRGTDFAPLVGAPGVLRFPHDPQGEAGMVINCRCVMVPEITEDQDTLKQ